MSFVEMFTSVWVCIYVSQAKSLIAEGETMYVRPKLNGIIMCIDFQHQSEKHPKFCCDQALRMRRCMGEYSRCIV